VRQEEMDSRLLELIGSKPRLITEFPEWMLSAETRAEMRDMEGLAILEIAGRDSFAAALQTAKTRDIRGYLPTIAYSGTQFGDWDVPFIKARELKKRLREVGIKVFDPLLVGDPTFWRLLCAKHASYLFKHMGFHSPCLGCHLYFHSIRIPIAKMLNCKLIVAGERESHEGRIKINQLPIALNEYVRFVDRFDIELALPLRKVASNAEVETILGGPWEEGAQQVQCVLSSNYQDPEGNPVYSEDAIRRFYEDYALELAENVISRCLLEI